MIRHILHLGFIILCAALALVSVGGLIEAQGAGRILWVVTLVAGTVGALRGSVASNWWPIVIHAASAILLGLIIGKGTGGPTAALGMMLHVVAGILWWLRPNLATMATIGLASASLAFAIFSIVFHWVCGSCFSVHSLMIAAVILLYRRNRLDGVAPEVFWRSGVAAVAAMGLVYIGLTCVPNLTRDPNDRALLALLAEWNSPLASVQSLPAAGAPGPGGIEFGAGDRSLEVFLAADATPAKADLETLATLATQGYRVHLSLLGGANGARDRAIAWTAAARRDPSKWSSLLNEAKIPAPDPVDAAAAEALVAAGVTRTTALDVRHLPAYILSTPTGTASVAALSSLASPQERR